MQTTQPKIKLGDIYWLAIESILLHPHVVIQVGDLPDTFLVCAVTTNMKKANMPGNILLEIGEGNLEKQSIVEVYKTHLVNKSQLTNFIGSLSSTRVDEILKGIAFVDRSYLQGKK